MDEKLEIKLLKAAALLTREENANDLLGQSTAHKAIQKAIAAIYQEKTDIPTIFRVEQIINDAHANTLGKSNEAHKANEMLAAQATTGFKMYEKFTKHTKTYVEWADATRENVQDGKPMAEGVPYCPIRSGLTEFRNQLINNLASPISKDPFPEREQTNRLRLDATIKVERDFVQTFIDNRKIPEKLKEQQKEKTLNDFDRRIKRQTQRAQPEKELPKRSRGMSL